MKKFTISLICCLFGILAVFIMPTNSNNKVFAEQTTEDSVYYPSMIDHYVDLTDINAFAFGNSSLFYSNKTEGILYDIYEYNLEEKTCNKIFTEKRNVTNIWVMNNVLVVLADASLYFYEIGTYEHQMTINMVTIPTAGISNLDCYYDNDTFIFVFNIGQQVQILKFTDISETPIYNQSLHLEYQIKKLTINEKYLYCIKDAIGANPKTIYLYDHTIPTLALSSSTNTNTPSLNYKDIDSMSVNGEHYFVATTEGENANLSIYESSFNNYKVFTPTQVAINRPQLVKTYANKVYVYDQTNKNIQLFNVTFTDTHINDLQTPEVFLAGQGSENGRFCNVNSMVLKNDGKIFVSDKGNNRIQILENNSISVISLGADAYASNLMLDEYGNLFYLKHTVASTTLQKYTGIGEPTTYAEFTNSIYINSATISLDNVIYVLNYQDNQITIVNTDNTHSALDVITTVDPNENSIIRYSNTYNELILTIDNLIYRVTCDSTALNSCIVNTNYLELVDNIIDLNIDYYNILYVLDDTSKLVKTSFENDIVSSTITDYKYLSCFALNYVSGKIYAFNNNQSCIYMLTNTLFSNGLRDFQHYQTAVMSPTGYSSIVKYGSLKANSLIYEYINYLGTSKSFDSIKNVIALTPRAAMNEPFYTYILYVDGNNLSTGYVKSSDITIGASPTLQNYNMRTTNQNVSVFKFPTLRNNVVITTIPLGREVSPVGRYPVSIDGMSPYYIVFMQNTNSYGYIHEDDLITNANVSTSIESNAEIKILDHTKGVDVMAEKGSVPFDKLTDGCKIYVKNYNKNSQYTLISYIDEDHQSCVGYVLTKYIDMDGMSSAVLTAIILFAVDMLIIIVLLVWFLIFKKHQKNKKKNGTLPQEKVKQTKSKTKSNNQTKQFDKKTATAIDDIEE